MCMNTHNFEVSASSLAFGTYRTDVCVNTLGIMVLLNSIVVSAVFHQRPYKLALRISVSIIHEVN